MSSTTRINQLKMTAVLLALAWIALLSGCSDDSLTPFEPELSNNTDSFSLQATGVTNVSQTRTYAWSNTGTTANINQATTVTRGSASLIILDVMGDDVYRDSLAENGTFTTTAGVVGDWTIRMVLSDFSGTINFSLEKP